MTIIIVSGLIARYPIGGNTWAYLQYVLGLERLGYNVYYLEDSSDLLCYNPELNVTDIDCTYCIEYLQTIMGRFGLANQWAYRVGDTCYGMSEKEVIDLCRKSDLLVNVSGALLLESKFHRQEYKYFKKKIFVDLEPTYTQFEYARDQESIGSKSLADHDEHFTVGLNIGGTDCVIPLRDIDWEKTQRPIVLDMWHPTIDPALTRFTTVMNWGDVFGTITYNGETYYGSKRVELMKFIDLPQLTNQKIELAIAVSREKPTILQDAGWCVINARTPSKDPWTYISYISKSRAEWSVAKNVYVKTRSGWFSDRSACYLAAAKPVLLQNTGFSEYLPTGRGLLAFHDMEDIVRGINAINHDYTSHCEEARRIAEQYFDSDKVLNDLLHQSGV